MGAQAVFASPDGYDDDYEPFVSLIFDFDRHIDLMKTIFTYEHKTSSPGLFAFDDRFRSYFYGFFLFSINYVLFVYLLIIFFLYYIIRIPFNFLIIEFGNYLIFNNSYFVHLYNVFSLQYVLKKRIYIWY